MAAFIRKNLTFFIFNHTSNTNIHFCKSPVSLPLSLHFFSTETPTQIDTNPTAVYDVLVHKHDFPCAFASMIASKLSDVKNPEIMFDSTLTFLKSSGFSNAQLQKILSFKPSYLCSSLENCIKPKIKGLQEEGFSSTDISNMISGNPQILSMSLNNNIIPSLSVVRGLLGTNTEVITVLKRSSWFLSCNMERTVVANVEFFKSCGLSMDRIRSVLLKYPQAFCMKSEVVRAAAEKAKEMGLGEASKAFAYAIVTISLLSKEMWELKLQSFRDLEFSECDILSMFRKEPRVFSVSTEKAKKITEGLVATGRYDLSSIVGYPLSLMFSFEKRYEPRIKILRIIESSNLIETWPPLHTFCYISNAEFFRRFVGPYSEHLVGVSFMH